MGHESPPFITAAPWPPLPHLRQFVPSYHGLFSYLYIPFSSNLFESIYSQQPQPSSPGTCSSTTLHNTPCMYFPWILVTVGRRKNCLQILRNCESESVRHRTTVTTKLLWSLSCLSSLTILVCYHSSRTREQRRLTDSRIMTWKGPAGGGGRLGEEG